MKKLSFMALVLSCLLLLSGCQELVYLLQSTIPENVYASDKYSAEFSDKWQYSLLEDELKPYYGSLYTAVADTLETDSIVSLSENEEPVDGVRVHFLDAEMTKEEIVSIYEAFFRDNPQFFFLDRTYQLEGYSNKKDEIIYNAIVLRYYMNAGQRTAISANLKSHVTEILADCPKSDEYKIEKYLHDQLAEYCTYDKQAAKADAEEDPAAYTAYGALLEYAAVCEGYAKAMQLLLQNANIPCTLVTGISGEDNEPHMWNLVKINGKTYHLDPTWNDAENGNLHTYFNLTTEKISATHIIDDNQEWLPKCTATKDNYFTRTKTYVDTYERRNIAQIVANRVMAGEEVIQLSFAKGKYENGLLFLRNVTLTNQYVNEYLENDYLWEYTLWVDEKQNVITMRKK